MKKSGLFLAIASLVLVTGCGGTGTSNTSGDVSASSTSATAQTIKIKLTGEGTVMVGKTTNLTVTLTHDTTKAGFDIAMADDSIATCSINSDGTVLITGKKVGTTKFTATAKADTTISASLDISVISVVNPVITIAADKTLATQKDTISLTATVTDYDGAITYNWKSLYSKGTFTGSTTSNAVTYTCNNFGSDTIQVSFQVGSDTFKKTIGVFIKADHTTGWTALSTADDVKTKLLTAATISGNYYLTADIDLANYTIPYTGSSFAGVLDGQGYSIKNYTVNGNTADKYSNGGFFSATEAGSIIANIGFDGVTIGEQGSGWGTAPICAACSGSLENIFVSVTHTFDNSSLIDSKQWYPFNSALVGVFKEGSTYRNIVVNVNKTPEAGYKTIFADVAYPAGGSQGTSAQNAQTFSVVNFYTDSTVIGGSVWEWGSPVEDQTTYHTGINWTNATVDSYADLDSHIFDIKENQMPTIKALA